MHNAKTKQKKVIAAVVKIVEGLNDPVLFIVAHGNVSQDDLRAALKNSSKYKHLSNHQIQLGFKNFERMVKILYYATLRNDKTINIPIVALENIIL